MTDRGLRSSLRTALLYIFLGTAWNVVSDAVLSRIPVGREHAFLIETLKGLLFVAGSAALIFWLVRAERRRWESAASELGEARDLLERVLGAISDAVFVIHIPTRTIHECNPAALRMFGYDRERLIGASTELVHQDREHYERFGRESDAVLARGESYRTRGSLRRADGEVFPTEQVVSYVRPGASGDGGDRDDPQFAVSVVRDISEEVAAQRAIRESRDLLEAILEATADGIFVKEPSGRIVFANEAAARMLGREAPEDVVGHDDEELLSPGSLEAIRAVDERVLSTGEPLRAEERIVTAAGDDRLYDVTVAPLQVGEGRPAIVGAARDVTDQRRTERALREAHRLLDAVVEGTSDSVYAKDREGRYLLMNGAGARRLGRTVDEVVGRRDVDLRADEDARRIRQDDLRVMASGETLTRTETMVSPDGGRTVFDTLKAPLRDGGEIVGIVGISRNVTEREEAEEALRRTESKYETLFHATPLGIDVASLGDGRVVELNEGLEQLLGYSRRELLGRRAPEMGVWVDPSDRERLIEQVRQRGHARGFGAQLRRKDGQVIEAEMFAESIEVGGDPHMLSVIQDVTERRAFERDLERMALHDALTGLANRTLFRDRLEHGLVTSGRQDAPVAVLFVDLDRFKVVNDTLGHPVGDRLLAEAADRLRACFREEDTVARLGGDEFGIVLEHVDSTADVEATARRVAEQFERPFRLGETDVHQAASVGIAVSSGDLSDPDDLLRFSDIAMYRAKEHKGSSWHLFDPAVDAEAGRQLYRENELRRAIDDEQFVLHFQPVVDLGTGRIVGAEALLRWDHPERGLLPPGSFIPLAEETGLIAALGRWVIRTAPGYLAAWEQGGDRAPELRLSINISAVQLQDPVVAEELRATLAASGFPASRLILEVTESVAIRTPEIIQSLRADGMEVAVDDLGTGYASLEYLTHLEVDIMKVDRLFVSGVGRDARDDAIVEAAALLAHRLDARAVAEGIETAEQLARLRDLGYDLGQGFYFSEPLEPEAFGKLLAEDPRW